MYFQKELIAAFMVGNVPGETGVPRHIETVISNVFIFDTNVYKIYKNDNQFFNKGFYNLSDKDIRFSFTSDDFAWNRRLTPDVYRELRGAVRTSATVRFTPVSAEADELVIVMARVDTENILFERLVREGISVEEAHHIGKGVAESLARARELAAPARDYYLEFGDRISDVRAWANSTKDEFEVGELERYLDYLDAFRENHKERFETVMSDELAYGGDIHSHNAHYVDGRVSLMDTYSPKPAWLIEHHSTPVYRVATDVWGLGGSKEHFDAFIRGYEEGSGKRINRDLDPLYIVYASLIALPYLYMLSAKDESKRPIAKRFHAFLRDYFKAV